MVAWQAGPKEPEVSIRQAQDERQSELLTLLPPSTRTHTGDSSWSTAGPWRDGSLPGALQDRGEMGPRLEHPRTVGGWIPTRGTPKRWGDGSPPGAPQNGVVGDGSLPGAPQDCGA